MNDLQKMTRDILLPPTGKLPSLVDRLDAVLQQKDQMINALRGTLAQYRKENDLLNEDVANLKATVKAQQDYINRMREGI